MTVTSVNEDFDQLSLTLAADFDAPVEQVWQLWADPRKLERWWGPPTYPATVDDFDLNPGGTVTYHMTGPEGDQPHGWWRVGSVAPPTHLEFTDGFADDDGRPLSDSPKIETRVTLTRRGTSGTGTHMELSSRFRSQDEMRQMSDMGMAEGMREAAGQMDRLLA
ncbi:SRPBCC domain-containing protein [Streptomyces sp. UH6]|uniref:SRPBCC family protein n=1 Tax=Streptomyces sp. UH6 TaxID=2748379 RepID=UPI0015D51D5C|nr:SRPBCC domain-containing protein [Streptomyces sp. UH6]NYV78040.1 SRPBCC domain-containing protein [Streptomyces sp. UH6]